MMVTCYECGFTFDREEDSYCPECECDEYEEVSENRLQNYRARHSPFLYVDSYGRRDTEIEGKVYMGIEIEADGGNVNSFFDNGHYNDFFLFKEDGSLSCEGVEVVTLPATLNAHKQKESLYSEVMTGLTNANYRSHNISGCGMHVHINKSFFTDNELVRIGFFINSNKDVFQMVGRRQNTTYSTYVKKSKIKGYSRNENEGRYESVNFNNSQTVEFRFFKGTLNVQSILKRLDLLDAIARFIKNTPTYRLIRGNGMKAFRKYLEKHRRDSVVDFLKEISDIYGREIL